MLLKTSQIIIEMNTFNTAGKTKTVITHKRARTNS